MRVAVCIFEKVSMWMDEDMRKVMKAGKRQDWLRNWAAFGSHYQVKVARIPYVRNPRG
jgi:hypothetical protein